MKKSKILAPALAILCLSTAASVTGTVAWFAANNVVSASGLTVQSTLPSSLAISNHVLPVGQATSVTMVEEAQILSPISHYHGVAETGDGKLYRVHNGEDVDPTTGLALSGKTLTFDEVASATNFYVDYVVYIGSVGQALTLGVGGALTASVNFSSINLTATNLATSISFYMFNGTIAASGDGTLMGTLNAAQINPSTNHGAYDGAALTSVDVFEYVAEGNNTIAVASSGTEALKITMRMYIDGALQNSANTTYVATNSVVNEEVLAAVSFSLNRGGTDTAD